MSNNLITRGIGTSTAGPQTKGKYVPIDRGTTDAGWGIVHLFRDFEETRGLCAESIGKGTDLWVDGLHKKHEGKPHPPPKDEDCTTLCILAVPSYCTPADFLAFVGEDTRDQVSHFRMVRTARANRYMVLMKFRDGRQARIWQDKWNGKVFNSMEPETCHVVFLKSVEVIISSSSDPSVSDTTYPRTPNDPFSNTPMAPTVAAKPLPPPTPCLVELPTCPVCLERMDETTGLLTILCQHVFHCTCLQKWSGGGCPVCRYTHDDFSSRLATSMKYPAKKQFSRDGEYEDIESDYGSAECETCRTPDSLWQCLICGKVGCGRYEGKHAHQHFEQSGHTFSMDLESKRVWDYSGDGYVHRIIQDAGGGEKVVELPARGTRRGEVLDNPEDEDEWGVKVESVALEYTHLLTSQLESQRIYFDEVVERAVDKASEASKRAELVSQQCKQLDVELIEMKVKIGGLTEDVIPNLEKERDRALRRADKFESLSRDVEKRYKQEKTMVTNMMERIKFLEDNDAKIKARATELEEENRDLLLNFTMAEKIRALGEEDVVEGTVGVPVPPAQQGGSGKRRKGKGRS